MVSQNVGHIMLGAARFVHIPEGPSGQRFHGMLLFLLFGTDGDRWLRLLSIFGTEDGIPGFVAHALIVDTACPPGS